MRKTFIMMMAALVVLAACENEVEVIEADNTPVVILNGLIDASSYTHHVHLSRGSGKSVKAVYDAHVHCYVNGELVSEGKPDEYGNSLSAPYLFNAVLKEGDVVRIETDKGVSAETVVPKAPVISKVDTLILAPEHMDDEGLIKFRITVEDIPGEENFYMADISSLQTISFMGFAEDDVYFSEHYLESDNDPLLDESLSTGKEEDDFIKDLIEALFGANEYNLFNDRTFADKSYTLKAKVAYGYLQRSFLTYSPWHYPYSYALVGSVAKLKVFSLDKTTFRYIKSVSATWTFGSYVIKSPVILPSNVRGGIGYLGAMNPGVAEVVFPQKRVPIYSGSLTESGR